MPLLNLWGRSERPVSSRRTRLAVLTLDERAAPSSLLATEDSQRDQIAWDAALNSLSPSHGPFFTMSSDPGEEEPDNLPPVIEDFLVTPLSTGVYVITGRVIDESPGGLRVDFGGIASAEGKFAITNSDGTFMLGIQLRTDGSDTGNMSADTRDSAGQASNTATYWVDPH